MSPSIRSIHEGWTESTGEIVKNSQDMYLKGEKLVLSLRIEYSFSYEIFSGQWEEACLDYWNELKI